MRGSRRVFWIMAALLLLPLLALAQFETIAIGDTVSGVLTAETPSVRYALNGTRNDIVTITLISSEFDAFLLLLGPDGGILATDDDGAGGSNARIAGLTLPESGLYTVVVDSYNSISTGAYTLTVEGMRAAPPGTPTNTPTPSPVPTATRFLPPTAVASRGSIALGETLDATLNRGDGAARFTFEAAAGQAVTITLTSDDFDAYLWLEDSAGSTLTQDDDRAGNLNARIEAFVLPADGVYTIVAGSYSGSGVGDFRLSLEQVEAPPVVIPSPTFDAPGQTATAIIATETAVADLLLSVTPTPITPTPLPVTEDPFLVTATAIIVDATATAEALLGLMPTPTPLDLPQPEAALSFGQTVTGTLPGGEAQAQYSFTGEAGQAVTITLRSGDFDAYLRLLDASGSEIASDDDSGGSLNAQIAFFVLPANGSYTVSAESFDGGGGSFTLSLFTSPVAPLSFNEPVESRLSSEQPVSGYRFQASAGDVIRLLATSTDFDIKLALIGPDGRQIASDDDSGGGTDALIDAVSLPQTGSYIVAVSSFSEAVLGRFSLRLDRVTLTPLSYGDSVTVTFGGDQSAAHFSFAGRAGEVITIQASSGGSFDTTLTLTGPDSAQVAFDDDGGPGYDPEIFRVELAQDGQYIITLKTFDAGESGSVTLTLLRDRSQPLDETGVDIRLNAKRYQQVMTFEGQAGALMRLSAQVIAGGAAVSPRIAITQNGQEVAAGSASRISSLILEFSVPADGPVLVRATDDYFSAVTLRLALTRVR